MEASVKNESPVDKYLKVTCNFNFDDNVCRITVSVFLFNPEL